MHHHARAAEWTPAHLTCSAHLGSRCTRTTEGTPAHVRLIRPRRHGRARCLSHRDDGQWQPPRSRRPACPWSYLKGSRTSRARHEGPTASSCSVLVIHTGHGGADGRRYAVLVGRWQGAMQRHGGTTLGAAAAWERWQEAARRNRDGVAVGSGLRVARVSRKQTGRTEGVGKLGRQSPIAAEVGP